MTLENKLLSAVDEAILLGNFKAFCEKNSNNTAKQRLRNILSRAKNTTNSIKALFINEMQISLSDLQAERMYELVDAFLNKSLYRKTISMDKKKQLLFLQNYKCKFCGCEINETAHADHIVPFKYVGDELQNNLQMLCSRCNEAKNASVDYEIKVLLKMK